MATWEDGPEFAPRYRPAAFTAPRVSELPKPQPVVSPADGAPVNRPADFTQPTAPAPALANLIPKPSAPRDPKVPFGIETMTLTRDSSAWGAAHSSVLQPAGLAGGPGFDPTSPIVAGGKQRGTAAAFAPPAPETQPSSFPAPAGTQAVTPAGAFAPPAGQVAAQGQPTASQSGPWQRVWAGLTPAFAVTLAVGCVLPFVSLITYIAAFALSFRVRQGQPGVRITMGVGLGIITAIAFVGILLNGDDFAGWWMFVGQFSLLTSLLTMMICVLVMYRSVNRPTTGGPF